MARRQARHERARNEATRAGNETDGGHWFTLAGNVKQLNVASGDVAIDAMRVAFAICYR